VILGALVELNQLTGNGTYLTTAATIAQSVINHMASNGVLTESAEYPDEDPTAAQFKGVFVRNLGYLNTAQSNGNYIRFLQTNADSIWSNDLTSAQDIGADWQGKPNFLF